MTRLAGLLGGTLTLESRVDVRTAATLWLPVTGAFDTTAVLSRVLVVDEVLEAVDGTSELEPSAPELLTAAAAAATRLVRSGL